MGFLFGLILEFLISLIIEVVFEFLMALGWVTVSSPFRKEREFPAPVAGLGIVLIASFIALVLHIFISKPVLVPPPFPGISMILSPLAVGGLAHLVGKHLERKGRPSSYLMTYWGGALFAFILAGTRFILLH